MPAKEEENDMKGKKGDIKAIIWMIAILFIVLFIGIGLAFGSMIIGWVADEAMPSITNLGMVGSANVTEYSGYTITPVNTVVQALSWAAGVAYVLVLLGCIGLSYAYRFSGNKWLAGFFISAMFLLIMASIFISNIYEEYYTGTNDVALRLQEQVLLSYLVLYSPLIFTIIGFICGIIMFTGEGVEETL